MQWTRRFTVLNGAALVVGVVAGLAAVAFRGMITTVQEVFFHGRLPSSMDEAVQESGEFLQTDWGYLVFLVPTLGGLVVGLIRLFIPAAQRQGVPEVIAAVQAKGGIIRGRTAWGHSVISAVTVGTGGSTGREGPIAYIGAAVGSSLGRRMGFNARDIKILLGSGASAGIAATFNAPLGGVLFALEIIIPEFSTHAFIPLVLATVLGVAVSHQFLGDQPAFLVPEFTFGHPMELVFYLILGLVCGLGGVGFIRLMASSQEIADRIPLTIWLRPALGGMLVGFLALGIWIVTDRAFFGGASNYHVFGTGYATLSAILSDNPVVLAVPLLVLLVVAKPLASSITIASGGGGGVFSSSLFQGAVWGALVGVLANLLFPGVASGVPNYALVGMGAFYASSGRATLTTIVLLSEMTQGYDIVLPLMFAAVAADAVSVNLSADSIYTVRLRKRGIRYDHDRVQSALDTLAVRDVMTEEVDTLPHALSVGEAWGRMMDLEHTGYPVVDEDDRLVGIVTRRDLSRALHENKGDTLLKDIVSGLTITAFPDELLHRARDRIFQQDIGRLIVVEPTDRRRVVGILTRSDVLRAEAEHDVEWTDAWKS